MTPEPDNIVPVYLRRIDEKLDHVLEDVRDLKVRVTNQEESFAKFELPIAGVNRRIDRVEASLDRIERRLDLAEAPH